MFKSVVVKICSRKCCRDCELIDCGAVRIAATMTLKADSIKSVSFSTIYKYVAINKVLQLYHFIDRQQSDKLRFQLNDRRNLFRFNGMSQTFDSHFFLFLSFVFCLSVCCMSWLPYGIINGDNRRRMTQSVSARPG